jgi:translation initiation factor 3 subunit I
VFNRDGDLLVSCDKEGNTFIWWADSGERIGTYGTSRGAVYSVDFDRSSKKLLIGSADTTVKLYEVETGRELYSWNNSVVVRCVKFAHGDRSFMTITENVMRFKAMIRVHQVPDDDGEFENPHKKVLHEIEEEEDIKIYKGIWGFNNETIITCNSDGSIRVYDTERQSLVKVVRAHEGPVTSIKPDKYGVTFISASKDGKAKLFDIRTMETVKTFNVGRPINCADISPLMEHVIMGGGERAEEVTTSGATTEQFQVRFYHSIFEEELGSVLGHFGPVNSIAFNPDGRSFASGGEDGYVRLRKFPESYFTTNEDDYRVY